MKITDLKAQDRVEMLVASRFQTPDSYFPAGTRGTVIGVYPASPVGDDELLLSLDTGIWQNVELYDAYGKCAVRKLSLLELIAEAAQ